MSYRLPRLMSTATAVYAGYALVRPEHLPRALRADGPATQGLSVLAQTYGVRDLAISLVGMLGTAPAVRLAMGLRIAMDLSDGVLLATGAAPDRAVRARVLAVTGGWAALNALAVGIDSGRRAEAAA